MIHHTTTVLEDEIQNWISLDGDYWLPVDRGPVPSDYDREDEIAKLFDGDGNFKPLTFARHILIHWGAKL